MPPTGAMVAWYESGYTASTNANGDGSTDFGWWQSERQRRLCCTDCLAFASPLRCLLRGELAGS